MRPLLTILLTYLLMPAAVAQPYASADGCANGQCPIIAAPGAVDGIGRQPPSLDTRAVVRITNASDNGRTLGSGTLVDADGERGLIVTCAHLFREGVGALRVTFPSQQTFDARLIKIDAEADLAALSIPAPGVEPVEIADDFPRRGDPLVSCGYGSDGQLWCNRGQALGYVATTGAHGTETLELSGSARFGDSGGPVFDRQRHLVAVLFGTNGRIVDGTYCGRVRRFLADLSPRFRARRPAAPPKNQPLPGPVEPSSPLVEVPPSTIAPPAVAAPSVPPQPPAPDRVEKLEQLMARIQQAWQSLSAKIDALAAAEAESRKDAHANGPSSPHVELPPGVESLNPPGPFDQPGPLGAIAEPWLSAKLAALLISLGVPGGVAGVAAAGAVYLVMRRGKQRVQVELDRLKARGGTEVAAAPSDEPSTPVDPAVVERHHNQYVAYEVTALDKAWAAAHAHVGQRYPGAVPYLKIAEGVKDQLLSGNNDPQLS